jgi:hypothetical protein
MCPGGVIGISMNNGFPGSYSRNGDCVIANRLVKPTDLGGPDFGKPVVVNSDNTYSDVARFIAAGGAMTAALFAGVAVREVKQATAYSAAATGNYAPGQPCDVIQRGSCVVTCNVGTPVANGPVYLRIAANGAIPAGVIGGFEAAADGGNSVLLTNCQWSTGVKDANGVAEITILQRLAA